ncbi:aminoglycoside phosphotransferase family protein [Rhodoferax saidenbachensis]|uniref:Aminoglycoside phosphotransferase n=1 Tax=Rhodoferax saidenbachensis TaxID=1484693 RepID=A0A1P8KEW8_9BURK|nr:phosphotransferase [Rhodoferax saidenbachensis]APW44580.1 aminoglycoside phosphotransferase [Rhodoferax saidenbachensis]
MSPSPAPSPNSPALPASEILWTDPTRQALFWDWFDRVQSVHQLDASTLGLASADASFRRYFRVQGPQGTLVIMDAPPDKENCQPFVDIAKLLTQAGLRAPDVLDWDQPHGFMLLTDLGTLTMMQFMDTRGDLNPTYSVTGQAQSAPPLDLYLGAVDTLVQWQLASQPGVLPPYDHALLQRELELFPQWYITAHRQVTLDAAQRKVLDDTFALLIQNNLSWPSVYVHRDFMPRNLMAPTLGTDVSSLPPEGAQPALGRPGGGLGASPGPLYWGVLDFQDAVYGPVTYDIASLMRDAFLSWDEDFCLDVTIRYWEKARKAGLPVGDDFGEFYRGLEWMGLQRHLKVAGIFARLTLRDGKPKYLADAPRFIHYIRSTCSRYSELKPLLRLVEKIEGIEVPNVFAFGRS